MTELRKQKAHAQELSSLAKRGDLTEDQKAAAMAGAQKLYGAAERLENPVFALPLDAPPWRIAEARRCQAVRVGDDVYLPTASSARYLLPIVVVRGPLFSSRTIELPADDAKPEDLPRTEISWIYGEHEGVARGPLLGAVDRRLYAVCIDAFSESPISSDGISAEPQQFSQYKLLGRLLQSGDGKIKNNPDSAKALLASLKRLSATRLVVQRKSKDLVVPSLVNFEQDGKDLWLRLPVKTAQLFGKHDHWAIPHEAFSPRITGLAAWITTFYSTHSRPFKLSFQQLFELSGSKGPLSQFRAKFCDALDRLKGSEAPDKLKVPEVPAAIRVKSYSLGPDASTITVVLHRWKGGRKSDDDEHGSENSST